MLSLHSYQVTPVSASSHVRCTYTSSSMVISCFVFYESFVRLIDAMVLRLKWDSYSNPYYYQENMENVHQVNKSACSPISNAMCRMIWIYYIEYKSNHIRSIHWMNIETKANENFRIQQAQMMVTLWFPNQIRMFQLEKNNQKTIENCLNI